MPDVEDELVEILDGASVSAVSLLAREGWRAVVAAVVIAVVGPAGYGVVSAVERASETLRKTASGVYTTLKRTVPRREPEGRNTVVVVSAVLLALFLAVVAVAVLAMEPLLVERTLLGDGGAGVVPAAIAFAVGLLAVKLVGEVLKAYKEIPASNAVMKWAAPILQVVGAVGAAVVASDVTGILTGMAVGMLVAAVIGVAVLLRLTTFSPWLLSRDGDVLADYRSYLPPTLYGRVLVAAQTVSFNLLVFVLEPTAAGAFGIALIIVMAVRLSLKSVNQIFPQIASELYRDGRVDAINALYQNTSLLALLLSLPVGAAAVAFRVDIMMLFSAAYVQYAVILPVVVVGQLHATGSGSVGYLIMMTDNERLNMVLQTILTAVTLAVAVFGTLEYGVYGLAGAHAFGFIVNNTVEVLFLRWREGVLSWTRRHVLAVALAVPLLIGFVTARILLPLPVAVLASVVGTAGFFRACARLCLREDERAAYRRWCQAVTDKWT